MLQTVWNELDFRVDVCRITKGAHTSIEQLQSYIYMTAVANKVMTIQNYQRDALNIIYSSNIITLLYMFRVSSTHLQEDTVVHKQHMVPSLSIRVLVSC